MRRRTRSRKTRELAASQPKATVVEWTRPGSKWAKIREAQAEVDAIDRHEKERLERHKTKKAVEKKMLKEADEREAARFVAMLESAVNEINEEDSLAEALIEIKKAGV